MSPNEKTASARIISDIIKADSIIEKSEMEKLGELRKKFDIRSEHLQKGQRMTFSEALSILRGMDKETIDDFLADLYDLSISDGSCCPKEALLILAIKYCFEDGLRDHSQVFSCNTKDFNITSDQYVVYVESDEDPGKNKEIQRNLAAIVNSLKVIGFDFIYLPKLVDEFKAMSPEYVKDVIHYMAPQLDRETTVNGIYQRMCNLTTYEFCQKVLCEENKVTAIRDTEPALLVSVGNSIVPYVDATGGSHSYMEFLKINIKEGVVGEVAKFCDIYREFVDDRIVMPLRSRRDRFKYFGFYKALLDFLVAGMSRDDGILRIDVSKKVLSVSNRPGINLRLSGDKMALFFLVICQNISNGGLFYVRDKRGSIDICGGLKNKAFEILKKTGASDPDDKFINFFDNLPVTLSKLKKELISARQLPELMSFIPQKTKKRREDGSDEIYYRVRINPERVAVKFNSSQYVPINEVEWEYAKKTHFNDNSK